MSENQTHDLDWLAFRYIAGELEDVDREQFELRLAEDQSAREAIAAAVELAQTIEAAERLPGAAEIAVARGAARTWRLAAIAAMATSLAVCLAVFFAVQGILADLSDSPAGPGTAAGQGEVSDALVMAWAETPQSVPATVPSSEGDAASEDVLPESGAAEENLETPEWMVIALSGIRGDAGAVVPINDGELQN